MVEWTLKEYRSPNPNKRKAAITKLATVARSPSISRDVLNPEELLEALAEDDTLLQEAAAEALAKLGDERGFLWLMSRIALASPDRPTAFARARAVEALGHIRNPLSVVELERVLLDDRDENVCAAAADALGRICDSHAIGALVAALFFARRGRDGERNVRRATMKALVAIGDAEALERESLRWTEAQQSSFDQDLKEVLDRIYRQRADARGFDQARDDLARWANEQRAATEVALQQLASDEWAVREQAVETLGHAGDAQAIDPLAAMLDDRNVNVRRAAAEAIGMIGDRSRWHSRKLTAETRQRALERLMAIGSRDASSAVRLAVVQALEQIGDQHATEFLKATLADRSENVRTAAEKALRSFEGRNAG